MAVHIRLSRAGAKKHPFYRIVVTDHRSPQGGRFLENIGTYDPTREPVHFTINQDRLDVLARQGRAAVGHGRPAAQAPGARRCRCAATAAPAAAK